MDEQELRKLAETIFEDIDGNKIDYGEGADKVDATVDYLFRYLRSVHAKAVEQTKQGGYSNFDVMKAMTELGNTSIQLAPNGNVKRANTGKNGFGEIVIAVSNEIILSMNKSNPPHFNLFIMDMDVFKDTKAKLVAAQQASHKEQEK